MGAQECNMGAWEQSMGARERRNLHGTNMGAVEAKTIRNVTKDK